jgi:hypothetical protein
MYQLLGLAAKAVGGCGYFFNQGCVLLGGLVHLGHGFHHLGNPGGLLGA